MTCRPKILRIVATALAVAIGAFGVGRAVLAEETMASRPTLAKPLLIGEWADICVLKDGEDYYLAHSSGRYRPAILIWRSKDLRTWKPVGYAVTEFNQGSIWLTDLAKVDGRYYAFFLKSFSWQSGGYVVSAASIDGPWTAPQATGLRPDAVFCKGDNGKRYLFSGSGYVNEIAADDLKATSTPQQVYNGWSIPKDWAVEMSPCLEGPKVMRRNDWWHLIEAEGGTFGPATSHMVVSARSHDPLGPFENSPHNPIIRTYSRAEPWWSKGHGQLVDGPNGQWYCILHGIMNGHRSLGRCTLIEPIEWTDDGWFKVARRWLPGWEQPVRVELPMSDEFDGKQLGLQWQFHGDCDLKRVALADGALTLQGRGEHPGASQPLTIQPMHRAYEIETEVEVSGEATAGLMLFAQPESYIGSAISKAGVVLRVQKGHQRYQWMKEPSIKRTRVALRIVNDKQDARFYYKDEAGQWQIMQPSMEVSQAVSTPANLRPAIFVCGEGEARFQYFRYRPLETAEELQRDLERQFLEAQSGVAKSLKPTASDRSKQ